MIIDCGVYDHARRWSDLEGPELVAQALDVDPGCFGWISLDEPTMTEQELVERLFGFRRMAFDEARRPHQRPKMETYEDLLVVVLRTLWYVEEASAVETGQISVLVGARMVVTVRHSGEGPVPVRRGLDRHAAALAHGPAAVLWAVCGEVVDSYETVAKSVAVDVDEIEASVFGERCSSEAERIYMLKREVLEMRHAVLPLHEPIERFARADPVTVNPAIAPHFRSLSDRVLRVCEQTQTLDTLLSAVLAAHIARVSVQQNDDLRRISAWVAIAAVPTMLAGIYGMNFDRMPELHWWYGYPSVLAAILVTCTLLYGGFRRAGWL
jgi:magnesium transporter